MVSILRSIAALIRSKRPSLADELLKSSLRSLEIPRIKVGKGRCRETLRRRGSV